MTKRQRNHKVKTYYEKYFKNKRIKDGQGYKVLPFYEPQGKQEPLKIPYCKFYPNQLLTFYKNNPYIPNGGIRLYMEDTHHLQDLNSGAVYQYNKDLSEYQLITYNEEDYHEN